MPHTKKSRKTAKYKKKAAKKKKATISLPTFNSNQRKQLESMGYLETPATPKPRK